MEKQMTLKEEQIPEICTSSFIMVYTANK